MSLIVLLDVLETKMVTSSCRHTKGVDESGRQRKEVMKIKVLDKYVEIGLEMKLLGVTFPRSS